MEIFSFYFFVHVDDFFNARGRIKMQKMGSEMSEKSFNSKLSKATYNRLA